MCPLEGDIVNLRGKDAEEEKNCREPAELPACPCPTQRRRSRIMAAFSKYVTGKNSSIAAGVLLALYLLKRRRRSPEKGR